MMRVSTNIFLSKFSSSTPHPPFWKISGSAPAWLVKKKSYVDIFHKSQLYCNTLNWFISPEPMSRLVFDWHLCMSLFQNHWTSFNKSSKGGSRTGEPPPPPPPKKGRCFFLFRQCIFAILLLSPLWKGRGPSCEQSWIPFTQGCFVPSLVEIGSVVLEKKIF